jgi:hypothetical protein
MADMRRTIPAVYELWSARSRNLLESLSYQLDRFEKFANQDQEWTTFILEATARAMNVSADRLSSHPGPESRRYSGDLDQLVRMFARMMYQSLLGEKLPAAQHDNTRTLKAETATLGASSDTDS